MFLIHIYTLDYTVRYDLIEDFQQGKAFIMDEKERGL